MTITYDAKRKPTVRILLPDKDKRAFKPEWKALLQTAFNGTNSSADDVAVNKRLSGYSDAHTFTIRVTYPDRSQSFVIKIGHRSTIENEFENSQKVDGNALYGNPIIPNRIYPRHGEQPVWHWAFMQSTLAESETLFTYLKKPTNQTPDHIAQIFKNVFKRRSDTIQGLGVDYAYRDYYDRMLTVHFSFTGRDIEGRVKNLVEIDGATLDSSTLSELERQLLRTQEIVYLKNFLIEKEDKEELTLCPDQPPTDEAFKIRIKYKLDKGQGPFERLGEPVALFATDPKTRSEILQAPVRSFFRKDSATARMASTFTYSRRNAKEANDSKDDKITYPNPIYYKDHLLEANNQMKMALIHGDLNLFNILISSDSSKTEEYLIDFADTKRGPVLLDFQWFEVNAILWLLAPEIKRPSVDNKAIIDILKALHHFHSEPPSHLQHLKLPYTVLYQIRLLAKPYLKDWSEYYRGLTLLLLGSLRLHGKPIPDLELYHLHVTFLCAATILCWTKLESVDLTRISKEILVPDFLQETPTEGTIEPPANGELSPTSDNSGELSMPIWPPEVNPDPSTKISPSASPEEISQNKDADEGIHTDKPVKPNSGTNRIDRRRFLQFAVGAGIVVASGAAGLYYLDPKLANCIIPQQTRKIRIALCVNKDTQDGLFYPYQEYGALIARDVLNRECMGVTIELQKDDLYDTGDNPIDKFIEVLNKDYDIIIGPSFSQDVTKILCPPLNSDDFNEIVNGRDADLQATLKNLCDDSGLDAQAKFDYKKSERIRNLLKEKETLIIGPSNTAKGIPALSDYYLRTSAPVAQSVALVLGKVAAGRNRAAIVYLEGDVFTLSEKEAFKAAIEQRFKALFNNLMEIPLNKNDDDFAKQVKEVLGEKIRPDLIIISGRPSDGGRFLRQFREKLEHQKTLSPADKQYSDTLQFIVGNGLNTPGIFRECGGRCDGVYLAQAYNPTNSSPRNQDLKNEYEKSYKDREDNLHPSAPPQFTAQVFVAVQVVYDALIRLRDRSDFFNMSSKALRQELRKKLLEDNKQMEFETPLGKISFTADGDVLQHDYDFCVARIEAHESADHKTVTGEFKIIA